jgi:perosamine synthetase
LLLLPVSDTIFRYKTLTKPSTESTTYTMKVRLSKPYIDKRDIAAVTEVLESGTLSLGPKLQEFKDAFAKYIGTKHAIAVNSGTSGLHLIIKSLGLQEGDEVITSPFSFVASANCILFEKATIVFADIDKKTYNIDPKKIEAAITPKTKAILVVHVFGQMSDMTAIMKIAKKHNLLVIEDACEAIGATHKGKKAGTFGDAAVFAFYPNKQITTGEGGMIVTNNDTVAALCKSYKNQGRDTMAWLGHSRIGYNYRLDEMSCALGVSQLKKVDKILTMRKNVADTYIKLLTGNKEVILPTIAKNNHESWFVFVIQVGKNVDRDKVITLMKEQEIATNIYFPPIHLQKFYKEDFGYKEGDFPITEEISKHTIALPFFSELSKKEISYVCKNLLKAIEQSRI